MGWSTVHISTPADCCAEERPLSALPGEPKFLPPSRAVIGSWWSLSFGEWKGLLPAYIFHRLREERDAGVPMETSCRFLCSIYALSSRGDGSPCLLSHSFIPGGICSRPFILLGSGKLT